MPTTSPCPNDKSLARLAAGQVAGSERNDLLRHIRGCTPCTQKIKKLPHGDTLLEEIRTLETAVDPPGKEMAKGEARPSSSGDAQQKPPSGRIVVEEGQGFAQGAEAPLGESLNFLLPPKEPDEIGRMGPYRILKVLGQGGMGAVFLAEDSQLRRSVALKVMLPDQAKKPESKERFLREARAAAAIEHEHIVTIYQVGEERGIPYIAMQLLKGASLDDWLRAREKKQPGKPVLQLPQIVKIGREIARGLDAAHQRGLIHRDIKPANIWLDSSQGGRVKILDFGLARPASPDSASAESQITQAGTILGTPSYMAPEQARGERVDGRADLFSLGCVLYRMCTGALPFCGPDMMSTLLAVATHNPAPPRELNPQLPERLSELVMRMLEKDPAKRIASAAEVARSLQGIDKEAGGKDIPLLKGDAADRSGRQEQAGRPPGPAWWSRYWPPSKAKLPWAIAGSSVGLLLVAAVFYVLFRGSGTDKEKQTSGLTPEPTRSATTSPTKPPPTQAAKPVPVKHAPPVAGLDNELIFDSGASVEVPTLQLDAGGPATIEAWVTPSRAAAGKPAHLVGFADHALQLRPKGTDYTLHWQGGSNEAREAGATAGAVGRRVHVAGVLDGLELRLYINGRLDDTAHLPSRRIGVPLKGFTIGGNFTGAIDEIRVSSIARYSSAFQPPDRHELDKDTVALYHCDEGEGNQLLDASPRKHHGKLNGVKWAGVGPPWKEAFNGKDLTGWQPVGSGKWTASGGVLRGEGSASWLASTADYENCEITFEYRLPENGDSGIFFRAWIEGAQNGSQFIEVQIQDDAHPSQAKTPPQRRNMSVFPFAAPRVDAAAANNTWHKVVARIQGLRVTVQLNGQRVTDADLSGMLNPIPGLLRERGRLGLQINRGWVEFRNIRTRQLLPPDTGAPAVAKAPFDASQAKVHQEVWAAHLGVLPEHVNSIGMRFRLIPPGEFTMGMTNEQLDLLLRTNPAEERHRWYRTAVPQHRVTITKPYYFGTYEVTQGQFERVMGRNPSTYRKGGINEDRLGARNPALFPVENVTWLEAIEFCNKLSEKEGLVPCYKISGQKVFRLEGTGYQLPTEAEWEFAARAGSQGLFWFGDPSATDQIAARSAVNPHACWTYTGGLDQVGQKRPNPFGVHDVVGNVSEMCEDLYLDRIYNRAPAVDPRGPTAGNTHVVRGSDFECANPFDASPLVRLPPVPPKAAAPQVGFRVILVVSPGAKPRAK